MKVNNQLQGLHHQVINNSETPNQTSTNISYDNSQLRSSIENGQNADWRDQKYNQQLQELYKELVQMVYKLNDQSINCRLKKLISVESREHQDLMHVIRTFFQILIQDKIQSEGVLKKRNESDQSDYETLLQKLEAEIRQHIRVEQQLKLYAETIQAKLDDHIKEQDKYDHKIFSQNEEISQQNELIKKFNLIINRYEKDIQYLKQDVKKVVKQYPSQPLRPVSNKDLHSYDQIKLDNLQRPILINLHLDRLETRLSLPRSRLDQIRSEKCSTYIKNKRSPNRQRVQTESDDLQLLIKKTMSRDKSQKPEQLPLKRHVSNKSYVDPSFLSLQKNKVDSTTRQKSLSKYSQSSVEANSAISQRNLANYQKSNASNTLDITQQLPTKNDLRPISQFQEGRSQDHDKRIGDYSDNQQKIKNLIQNFHMRNQTETYSSNKLDERKKKPACKTQHY